MDLLFKRYASPFLLIDEYISIKNFEKFIIDFIDTLNEEKKNDFEWDYFLHRVFDKSFNEFKEDMKNSRDNLEMSEKEQETTVLNSLNILGSFNPTTKG